MARLPRNIIYTVVLLISVLLVVNNVLTYYNNRIIARNRNIQTEAERINLYYDQIGKSVIHSIDIGLRGFAIVRTKQFSDPLYQGVLVKDSIIRNIELPLQSLNFKSRKFEALKDSIDSFAFHALQLKDLLDRGEEEAFARGFAQDRGAYLWETYLQVEKEIHNFVDHVDREARASYDAAMLRNQILQLLILVICVPTLVYTASFALKNFTLSEKLRKTEEEKNKMLKERNEDLELKVYERMQEILAQNEEISEQREALAIQNKQLFEAQKTIELQHEEIRLMNTQLKTDVTLRTHELREANKHLVEQNNQLEQFAFIAAHNLRAPLTRILGLANLMHMSSTESDREVALEKIVTSTQDLDLVVSDLNQILNIKRHSANLSEVDLEAILDRVKRTLEKEISLTHAVVTSDFSAARKVIAVSAYVESIFYNLLSNAIKYRHPSRAPFIIIETSSDDTTIQLTVSDNGLGIDLKQHGHQVFSLYKRFHLHMEGKGLGLYLVKTQIESMGGKVALKSTPNEGSVFTICFPIMVETTK
jgi:signal transduction histidine kinase